MITGCAVSALLLHHYRRVVVRRAVKYDFAGALAQLLPDIESVRSCGALSCSKPALRGVIPTQPAEHIETGTVYDRDLPSLAAALSDVLSALNRRPAWRRQHPS
jgi:hypothetical protein